MTKNLISHAVPEQQVRAILARAAELERTAPAVTLDTIRAAALEAQINPVAIEQAVAEYLAGQTRTAVKKPRDTAAGWRTWLKKTANRFELTGLGFVLGFASVVGEAFLPVALIACIATAVRLTWQDRKTGSATRMLAGLGKITAGVTAAWIALGDNADVIAPLLLVTAASAMLGTLFIRLGSVSDNAANDDAAGATNALVPVSDGF